MSSLVLDRTTEHDDNFTNQIDASQPNSLQHQKHPSSNCFSIYYQNVNGLCTKSKQFFRNSSEADYSVIALTETGLNSSFFSAEYFNSSYIVYRTDRESTNVNLERGGGTLIAVRGTLTAVAVQLDGFDDIEFTCVKIRQDKNSHLFVYVAYIRPSSPAQAYSDHLNAINSIKLDKSDSIFVFGDFNIPNAKWIYTGDDDFDDDIYGALIPTNVSPPYKSEFLMELLSRGLNQVNHIPNDDGNLLDLIFNDNFFDVEVTSPQLPLTPVEDYHPALLVTFESVFDSPASTESTYRRNFNRTDFIGLCNFLNDANIVENIVPLSLDDKIAFLYDLLNRGIAEFVPFSKRKRFKNAWGNSKLQKLKNKRNKEWKRYQNTGDKASFDRAFAEFDALNTSLYSNYTSKIETSLKENPSSFWRYVNSKRNVDALPKLFRHGNRTSTDPGEQATMFAEFFNENFSSVSSIRQPLQITHNPNSPQNFLLDKYFVFDELMKIKTSTGAGPDGIHPLILRNCASVLFEPLTLIFNESLNSGIFPEVWKRYSVTPFFKKGARADIANYRCIAKLQTIAKFFEHCINVHLVNWISPKISDRQHGFMKKRSTTSNLMEFTHFTLNGLSVAKRVDVAYLDFSKAFDRVDHSILLQKLATFDIPQNILSWMKTYLSSRRQYVKMGDHESTDFIVNSGVPQGSHIGPTIFIAFINDLPSIASDEVFLSMFADDVRAAKIIRGEGDTFVLQTFIDALEQWCNTNELHLNIGKCAIMPIHRHKSAPIPMYFYGNHRIASAGDQRDLGVIIDDKLSFTAHIDKVVPKAYAALGFLKRFCFDITDQSTIKTIYSALVQSKLDYCSTVWLTIPSMRADKIESILRQFTMYACREYPNANNDYHITSYIDRLKKLNMISLNRRRINNALLFFYDLLNDNIHCPFVKSLFCINPNVRNFRDPERFKITDLNISRNPNAPITLICKYANLVKNIFIDATSRNNFKNLLSKISDETFLI